LENNKFLCVICYVNAQLILPQLTSVINDRVKLTLKLYRNVKWRDNCTTYFYELQLRMFVIC